MWGFWPPSGRVVGWFEYFRGIRMWRRECPQRAEMRGRGGWDFFLVVNGIIVRVSARFRLDFLFFEVRLLFCINAADYIAK